MTTQGDRQRAIRHLIQRDRIRRANSLSVPPLIEQAVEEFVALLDAIRPPRPA